MQEVTDYKLVENGTAELLTRDVKENMAQGWVPSGTVIVFNGMMIQAMVKFSGD